MKKNNLCKAQKKLCKIFKEKEKIKTSFEFEIEVCEKYFSALSKEQRNVLIKKYKNKP